MSETPDPELHEYETIEPIELASGVIDTWSWLELACRVLSTLSLMLIAITLIARL